MNWNKFLVAALHITAGALIKHGIAHEETIYWLGGLVAAVMGYLAHNAPPATVKQDLQGLPGKVLKLALVFALMSFAPAKGRAQTTIAPTTNIQTSLQMLWDSLTPSTNLYVPVYGTYASGLTHKWGAGFGIFSPLTTNGLTTNLFYGGRLDYVDGSFWMPSGNATVQVPINLFKIGSYQITLSPLAYAGFGIPVSGAQVAGITLPGHTPTDNNGQITAIYGAGAALKLFSMDGYWLKDVQVFYEEEHWSNFPGTQKHVGLIGHLRIPGW